jgi:hypothetical protein
MGPGVPDLGRIVEQATKPQDPWALMVGVPGPAGQQQLPVTIGIFLMLDAIASRLERIAIALEQANALKVANG